MYWNGNERVSASSWEDTPTKRGELPLVHPRGGPKRD